MDVFTTGVTWIGPCIRQDLEVAFYEAALVYRNDGRQPSSFICKTGDTVLLSSGFKIPFVGIIQSMHEVKKTSAKLVKVRWFYRCSELAICFPGFSFESFDCQSELFLSNDIDDNAMDIITGPCIVSSSKSFSTPMLPINMSDTVDYIYYCRFGIHFNDSKSFGLWDLTNFLQLQLDITPFLSAEILSSAVHLYPSPLALPSAASSTVPSENQLATCLDPLVETHPVAGIPTGSVSSAPEVSVLHCFQRKSIMSPMEFQALGISISDDDSARSSSGPVGGGLEGGVLSVDNEDEKLHNTHFKQSLIGSMKNSNDTPTNSVMTRRVRRGGVKIGTRFQADVGDSICSPHEASRGATRGILGPPNGLQSNNIESETGKEHHELCWRGDSETFINRDKSNRFKHWFCTGVERRQVDGRYSECCEVCSVIGSSVGSPETIVAPCSPAPPDITSGELRQYLLACEQMVRTLNPPAGKRNGQSKRKNEDQNHKHIGRPKKMKSISVESEEQFMEPLALISPIFWSYAHDLLFSCQFNVSAAISRIQELLHTPFTDPTAIDASSRPDTAIEKSASPSSAGNAKDEIIDDAQSCDDSIALDEDAQSPPHQILMSSSVLLGPPPVALVDEALMRSPSALDYVATKTEMCNIIMRYLSTEDDHLWSQLSANESSASQQDQAALTLEQSKKLLLAWRVLGKHCYTHKKFLDAVERDSIESIVPANGNDEIKSLVILWTSQELNSIWTAFAKFGDDMNMLHASVPSKRMPEVVDYYFRCMYNGS